MQLSREEVTRIAWLARLALSEEETTRFAGQLSGVLEHVERLAALNVDDIEPTAMAAEAEGNVVRADVPRPASPQDEIIANAGDTEAGAFRVRAILEETA